MLRLVQEIQNVVAAGDVNGAAVSHMEGLVQAAGERLQDAVLCQSPLQPGRYLCYQDPTYGFVIMVLSWGPGDATPIHDHGVWGIETVLKESLRVTTYTDSETDPQPVRTFILKAGDVMTNLPPARDVHKVEHASGAYALSLHVYGKALTNNRAFVPGHGFQVCKLTCQELRLADVCKPGTACR